MLFFEEPTQREKTVEERFFEAVYPIEGRLIKNERLNNI